VKGTWSENTRVVLNEQQMNKSAKNWSKPKARRQRKRQSKTMRAKSTAMAHQRVPAAITRWPTADLPVNSDY